MLKSTCLSLLIFAYWVEPINCRYSIEDMGNLNWRLPTEHIHCNGMGLGFLGPEQCVRETDGHFNQVRSESCVTAMVNSPIIGQ